MTGMVLVNMVMRTVTSKAPIKIEIVKTINYSPLSESGKRTYQARVIAYLSFWHVAENGKKAGFRRVHEMPGPIGLDIEHPTMQSFTPTNISSEYECFQAIQGYYGDDFPIDEYNRKLLGLALESQLHSGPVYLTETMTLVLSPRDCDPDFNQYKKNYIRIEAEVKLAADENNPKSRDLNLADLTVNYRDVHQSPAK